MAGERVAALQRSPLLQTLPIDYMEALAAHVNPQHFDAGATLFRKGDPGHSLFVIVEGEVAIGVTPDDAPEVIVALLGQGDTFGELSLLDGLPRSASATAVQATTCMVLFRDHFLDCIRTRPELGLSFLRTLAGMIRDTNDQLADAAMLNVHGRMAKAFLRLAQRHGRETDEGIVLGRRVTPAELAGHAGLFPVEVERLLMEYQYRDVVRMQDGFLVLHDLETLERSSYARLPRKLNPTTSLPA